MNLLNKSSVKILLMFGVMISFLANVDSCPSERGKKLKKRNPQGPPSLPPPVATPAPVTTPIGLPQSPESREENSPPTPRRSSEPPSPKRNEPLQIDTGEKPSTDPTSPVSTVPSTPVSPTFSEPQSPGTPFTTPPSSRRPSVSEDHMSTDEFSLDEKAKFGKMYKAFTESVLSTPGLFLNLDQMDDTMLGRVNKIDREVLENNKLGITSPYNGDDAIALSYAVLLFLKNTKKPILSDAVCLKLKSFNPLKASEKASLIEDINREPNKEIIVEILGLGNMLKGYESQNKLQTKQYAKVMGALLCRVTEESFSGKQVWGMSNLISQYNPELYHAAI